MMQDTGKTGTVLLSLPSSGLDEEQYLQWHEELISIAGKYDNFLSGDFLKPIDDKKDQWVQVLSYSSVESLRSLLEDASYRKAIADSEIKFGHAVTEQVFVYKKTDDSQVTVVISHSLNPGFENDYRNWQKEVDAAAAKFPGFLATELIEPVSDLQSEWVVVFRFDTVEHLENWFTSSAHEQLVKKAQPFFRRVQVRRMGTGMNEWISNAAGTSDTGPTQLRMAMVVLLVLYPTVMVLTLYVMPLMGNTPFAVSMFVSNVMSVVILTWLLLPVVTRVLSFWLDHKNANDRMKSFIGFGLNILFYILFVALFYSAGSGFIDN